eukprot:jgi/Chlat1/3230/Chrsp22S03511
MAARKSGGVDGRREAMTAEDVEFLLRRSRWWLEATLNQDFGSTDDFATLIQDGTILQQVAKGLKRMRTQPNIIKSAAFGKREKNAPGGFMNYARASDFTIVCQEFGVNDVELCSSADIVDKRNTRRVCTCIRLLAKNALEQGLDVLDFDEVSGRVWRMPARKPEDSVSVTPVERSPVKGVQPAHVVAQSTTEASHANGQEATSTEPPQEPAAPPPETPEPSSLLPSSESKATPPETSQLQDVLLAPVTIPLHKTAITQPVADMSQLEEIALPAVTIPAHESTITQSAGNTSPEEPEDVPLHAVTIPPPETSTTIQAVAAPLEEVIEPEEAPLPDSASLLPVDEPTFAPSSSGHEQEEAPAVSIGNEDASYNRDVHQAASTGLAVQELLSRTQTALPEEQPYKAASTPPLAIKEVALPLSGTIEAVEVPATPEEDAAPVVKRKRTGFFFGGYVVKRGDCLTWISEERCRTRHWKPLAVLNSDVVRNPDLIYPGDRLRLPK